MHTCIGRVYLNLQRNHIRIRYYSHFDSLLRQILFMLTSRFYKLCGNKLINKLFKIDNELTYFMRHKHD